MESAEAWSTWVPDTYDISKKPPLESTWCINPDIEVVNDFSRQAKWCSDGSALLSQSESGKFHLFNVTDQFSTGPRHPQVVICATNIVKLITARSLVKPNGPSKEFPQPSPILDFIWYPTASMHDLASFCFVASVRECPVKLLDASDGRLRASYRIVDHRERQIAPHSLCFNLTAQKLYCGFEDAIEIFDLSRPGEGTRMPTTPSKKSKDGLKGIISSLAFSPSFSLDECFYAAGSFTPTADNIAMFSDAQLEPLMYVGGGPRAGVTQLKFNPMKPHILYAGYRGHANGFVYSWDIRSNVDTPLEIFQVLKDSDLRTNQKFRFDIDVPGRLLSMGDQRGDISIFELQSSGAEQSTQDTLLPSVKDPKISRPTCKFKAHNDAVGSVAFHPFESRLLSASGSRHFLDENQKHKHASSDESEASDDGRPSGSAVRREKRPVQPVTFDSTMKIWDLRKRG